jgi:hypothetical protein
MNVLVASMGRSGSTLLYNIIKTKNLNVRHCHYFDKNLLNWADVIISTKRDIREQLASTKRYLIKLNEDFYTRKSDGTHNSLLEECDMSIKIYLDWLPHTSKIMNLEDWFTNPKEYVKTVFKVLNFNLDNEEVNSIVHRFKDKSVKPKHITKTNELINYNNTLTDEEVNQVIEHVKKNYEDIINELLYIENYEKK